MELSHFSEESSIEVFVPRVKESRRDATRCMGD